jgi:hypothetical protein
MTQEADCSAARHYDFGFELHADDAAHVIEKARANGIAFKLLVQFTAVQDGID